MDLPASPPGRVMARLVGPDDVVLGDARRLGQHRRVAGRRIGALVLAFLALYWRRLPLLRRGYEPGAGLTAPIQRFQSGVINDYVTWMVLGLAVIGGVLALIIR